MLVTVNLWSHKRLRGLHVVICVGFTNMSSSYYRNTRNNNVNRLSSNPVFLQLLAGHESDGLAEEL